MGAANPFKKPGGGAFSQITPTNSSESNNRISDFENTLRQVNPAFFSRGFELFNQGFGTGTNPLIEAQRERGSSRLNASLARRGFTGGVAANEQARLNQGFDIRAGEQRRLDREEGSGLISTGLQNAAALPTLQIAQEAAQNAGRGGGGGGKK